MRISKDLHSVFSAAADRNSPVLSVVTGTKPDFYKQAPLVIEAVKEKLPVFVINTGQHFDEVLGHGLKEFNLSSHVGCNMQIRGDLMEKASELILKFGLFGRYCSQQIGRAPLLPVVHGDTLVAGIAPLAWVFGMGQKVGQNEAGLRSMSPQIIRTLAPKKHPTKADVERLVSSEFAGKWFLAREEPFPEQIDTWICSAGTQFFFAPTRLNKENLVREGYPEEFIHVVGNSVVDAIYQKRMEKASASVFDLYPRLEEGEWIRMDIHRRENLTRTRFESIIKALVELIRNSEEKIVLVMLNAMASALKRYGLESTIDALARDFPNKFMVTPLWKEYAHVVEFLDSGKCWAEMTDSGSMQEELLYFPKVACLTIRLNTDRPETVFEAKNNLLIPPMNSEWIVSLVKAASAGKAGLANLTRRKKRIYGQPGEVSKKVIRIIKKEFDSGEANFYPWLHQRLGLWKEEEGLDYL